MSASKIGSIGKKYLAWGSVVSILVLGGYNNCSQQKKFTLNRTFAESRYDLFRSTRGSDEALFALDMDAQGKDQGQFDITMATAGANSAPFLSNLLSERLNIRGVRYYPTNNSVRWLIGNTTVGRADCLATEKGREVLTLSLSDDKSKLAVRVLVNKDKPRWRKFDCIGTNDTNGSLPSDYAYETLTYDVAGLLKTNDDISCLIRSADLAYRYFALVLERAPVNLNEFSQGVQGLLKEGEMCNPLKNGEIYNYISNVTQGYIDSHIELFQTPSDVKSDEDKVGFYMRVGHDIIPDEDGFIPLKSQLKTDIENCQTPDKIRSCIDYSGVQHIEPLGAGLNLKLGFLASVKRMIDLMNPDLVKKTPVPSPSVVPSPNPSSTPAPTPAPVPSSVPAVKVMLKLISTRYPQGLDLQNAVVTLAGDHSEKLELVGMTAKVASDVSACFWPNDFGFWNCERGATPTPVKTNIDFSKGASVVLDYDSILTNSFSNQTIVTVSIKDQPSFRVRFVNLADLKTSTTAVKAVTCEIPEGTMCLRTDNQSILKWGDTIESSKLCTVTGQDQKSANTFGVIVGKTFVCNASGKFEAAGGNVLGCKIEDTWLSHISGSHCSGYKYLKDGATCSYDSVPYVCKGTPEVNSTSWIKQ